ncbi:alpha/beta hydrolase family protein [Pontibacillus yanchengensis]|uniref:Alpha/beta hydrolase n=1 Tax=Pontibacillus yanchengensis Y32 TaxID=1385514 RepID=A0A0A2TBX9_9BACI|nr:alpha/beta fold hydrolase [Pontibacillus yanchengensis]KGP71913.1 alpha/beta hydrolase [Pontibacillus yanchengensis Y32]
MKQMSLFLVMLLIVVGCSQMNDNTNSPNESIDISGTWTGFIEVPGSPLPIVLEFVKENKWKGMISIPSQNVSDYPLSGLTVNEQNVTFSMEIAGQSISFKGEVSNETFEGTFTQQGQSFPFKMTKGELEKEREEAGETISIETEKGTLKGVLLTPETNNPHPVVLIIPGSGPTDRNGNSSQLPGNNNSLKLLAERLAEEGIASLRYDKRGVGKNQSIISKEEDISFDLFVNDATHWIEKLNNSDRFTNVGVIGHSQGSLVGMLAAQQSEVDTFVSIAGASRSIDEVIQEQLAASLSEETLQRSQSIFDILKKGKTTQDVPKELQSVLRPSIQPFISSWMNYTPVSEINKLTIPTLIIGGSTDLQVPPEAAKALHEANNESEVIIIDQMNHVLKKAPMNREENVKTYSEPRLPLAEELVEEIMSFFQKHDFYTKE